MSNLRYEAIAPETLDRIRAAGVDDFGNSLAPETGPEVVGSPLRCCLREADAGDKIVLIAYRPASVGGPYAEVGPVFVHAEACGGYPSTDVYPPGYRHRRVLLRAYDAEGRQMESRIVEGDVAEAALDELLGAPDAAAWVHARNVLAGCYMFEINLR